MMSGRPAGNRWGSTMPTMPTMPTVIAAIVVTAASRRRNVVAAAPAAVSRNVRFIVAADVADSHGAIVAWAHHTHTGGDQAEQQHTDDTGLPRHRFNAHFGSTLVSVSDHSITATAAPVGSTITAILPPWRSTNGSTTTRPPSSTAFAEVPTASSTRMKLSQWG